MLSQVNAFKRGDNGFKGAIRLIGVGQVWGCKLINPVSSPVDIRLKSITWNSDTIDNALCFFHQLLTDNGGEIDIGNSSSVVDVANYAVLSEYYDLWLALPPNKTFKRLVMPTAGNYQFLFDGDVLITPGNAIGFGGLTGSGALVFANFTWDETRR